MTTVDWRMKIVGRTDINNREKNHLYDLHVLERGKPETIKMPYPCDCCTKSAIYMKQGKLLCLDCFLEARARKAASQAVDSLQSS